MNQAVFCVTPISRWSLRLDVPLRPGGQQVDRERPLAVAELRAFERRAGSQREHRLARALATAVRHGAVLDPRLDVEGAAPWAVRAIRPALVLEPVPRRVVIGEHVGQLDEGDAFPVALPGAFPCHSDGLRLLLPM